MSLRPSWTRVLAAVAGACAGWAVAVAVRGSEAPGQDASSLSQPENGEGRSVRGDVTIPSSAPAALQREPVATTDPRSVELYYGTYVFEKSLDELSKVTYWNPKGAVLDERAKSELTSWLAEKKREWEACRDRWTGESYRACEEAFAEGRVHRVYVMPVHGLFAFPAFPKIHPSQAEQNKRTWTTLVQTMVTPSDAPGLVGLKEAADEIVLEAHDRVKAAFGGDD